MLKFFVFSVALALNGNHFVLCKENNSNNKMFKVYNFRIKSGTGKWSIGCLAAILWKCSLIQISHYSFSYFDKNREKENTYYIYIKTKIVWCLPCSTKTHSKRIPKNIEWVIIVFHQLSNFSAMSWWQVTFMTRWWWRCLLCTRPTCI